MDRRNQPREFQILDKDGFTRPTRLRATAGDIWRPLEITWKIAAVNRKGGNSTEPAAIRVMEIVDFNLSQTEQIVGVD